MVNSPVDASGKNNWNIPIAHVARLIVNYVENTKLYRDHLCQVPEAASKFDPKTLLEKYEGVYLGLIKKQRSLTGEPSNI